MEKLYYTQPYLTRTTCTITSVTHASTATLVQTNPTIFYPEGGGQSGDRGTLGPFPVLDTRKQPDGTSLLILPPSTPINQAEVFDQTLDWSHRYKFMVMHTAQHLLSALLFTHFHIGTVSVHQGEQYLTIETDKAEIDPALIEQLIQLANTAITENHKVHYLEMSHEEALNLHMRRSIKVQGPVRIVQIDGIDRVACGGVHVASTLEIGLIYCLSQEQIRGHVRLYFCCGQDAVSNLLSEHKILHSLTSTLSCSPSDLPTKITSLQTQLSQAKTIAAHSQRQLAVYQITQLLTSDLCLIQTEADTDLQPYAQAANSFADLALLCLSPSTDGSITKWLIALKGKYSQINFNSQIRPLLQKINAKGGGKTPIFQGIASNPDPSELAHFIDALRSIIGAIKS